MKTFTDIQLAISHLPATEQRRLAAWINTQASLDEWSVREAAPNYGFTPNMASIHNAVQSLNPQEIRELRDWLQLIEKETPQMLAAIDEGLRSLKEQGGIELTREELTAKVRRWAGMSS